MLALLAAIVVVRALGLIRAFARYGERLAAHDAAFAEPRRTARALVSPARRAHASDLPAADLLSRFVIDVDELQHRDLRVRWPAAIAATAIVTTTLLATAIHPPAGLVLGAGLVTSATLVPALAYLSARHQLRRQGGARAALVDELVEALDSAPELALAGRTQERLARLDAASDDLTRIARRDAAAAALAQGLGTLVAGATLIGVLLVGTPLEPVWLGALALLTLGAFEATAPLPEAAVRAVGVTRRGAPAGRGVCPQTCARRHSGHTPTSSARESPAPSRRWTARPRRRRHRTPARRTRRADRRERRGQDRARPPARRADGTRRGRDEPRARRGSPARTRTCSRPRSPTTSASATRDATDDEIDRALRATGLGDWLDALPDGHDTLVGEEGFAVSGGQRQRIALARCLVSPADHLILDEPTAMLDPPAARAFLHDLDRAASHRGVLVITHEHDHLQAFDRVLELRDGRLHEQTPV